MLTESRMVEELQWPRTNMEEKIRQYIHSVVIPMFNPTMMKEVAMSEPGILTMMEYQLMGMKNVKMKEVMPYMVTVMM